MHAPTEDHFRALKRILRYVKGTVLHGLQLHRNPYRDLLAYSDADWAGCPDTRRFTTGYLTFLGPIISPGAPRNNPLFLAPVPKLNIDP
jgi:hypothetical protein